MKLYIVKWPNGTLTILTASSKKDLFFKLDEEGDPSEAEITCVNFGDDVHITTDFVRSCEDAKPVLNKNGFPNLNWDLGEYACSPKKRKVSFE